MSGRAEESRKFEKAYPSFQHGFKSIESLIFAFYRQERLDENKWYISF